MYPTDFPESNGIADKPESMSIEECEPINIAQGITTDGNPIIITCWKPTAEELEEINRTKRVWCFHYGNYLQPHILLGLNPFQPIEENNIKETR